MAGMSRRRAFGNVALSAITLILTLIVAELVLRLMFYGNFDRPQYGNTFHAPHPTRGWALRPDFEARMQELDFNVSVRINSKGLRDREHDYERTPGVFRILIVADSAMIGSGVLMEENTPNRLGHILGDDNVEVVNLSVAAYSTVQEYVFFMEEGLKYRPDLVLLGFAPGNDIQTNYEPLQRLFQKSLRRPYAKLDAAGGIVIDYSYAEAAVARESARPEPSAIGAFLRNTVLFRLGQATGRKFTGDKRVDPNIFLGWPYLEDFVPEYAVGGLTRADYERLWSEGWAVTRALIRRMQAESQRIGARFAMFVSPSKLQGDPEFRARVEAAFPNIRIDVAKMDRELRAFGDSIDAPVLELLPAFLAAAGAGRSDLFYDFEDEHWTAPAHALVAEALARQLRELGLVPVGAGD